MSAKRSVLVSDKYRDTKIETFIYPLRYVLFVK